MIHDDILNQVKKTSEELIKEFLENGGKITKLRDRNTPPKLEEIKMKPSLDFNSRSYAKKSMDE